MVRFSGVVVIVFIIFFSISKTKLPNYPMPCYPFAAVILGNFIAALIKEKVTSKKYPLYILLLITVIVPVAAYFAIQQEKEVSYLSWLPTLLLIVPAIFIFFLLINKKTDWQRLVALIVVIFSLFNILLLHYIYPTLYNQNPVSKTINLVRELPVVLSYREYNPAYNFYLKDNIKIYQSLDSLNVQLQQNPGAIIISRKEFADSLKLINLDIIAEHHDLFELPTTIILKQHANP